MARIVVSAASVVLSLAVMEIALRVVTPIQRVVGPIGSYYQFDPELGWIGKPSVEARFCKPDFDVLLGHNAAGFRRTPSLAPQSPEKTIAVLGDSFVWGWGVDDGCVVTDVLQSVGNPPWKVENFGVNAYGTLQESLLLKRLVAQGVKPTTVILLFFENDFNDTTAQATNRPWADVDDTGCVVRNIPVAEDHITDSSLRALLDRSRLFSTIAYVANLWKARSQQAPAGEASNAQVPVAQRAIDAVAFCLRDIRTTCETVNARFLVVYVPAVQDIQGVGGPAAATALRAACDSATVESLDLTPAFREASAGDPGRLYFPNDQHWTAEGHRVAAATIHRHLTRDQPAE